MAISAIPTVEVLAGEWIISKVTRRKRRRELTLLVTPFNTVMMRSRVPSAVLIPISRGELAKYAPLHASIST
jgi:hypothetical protein